MYHVTSIVRATRTPVPTFSAVAAVLPEPPWELWIDLQINCTWPRHAKLRIVSELVYYATLVAYAKGRLSARQFGNVYGLRGLFLGIGDPMMWGPAILFPAVMPYRL